MLHMLQGAWTQVGEAEFSEEHHNWKYRIAGADIEGDELVLVIAVEIDENRITVITKY